MPFFVPSAALTGGLATQQRARQAQAPGFLAGIPPIVWLAALGLGAWWFFSRRRR